jgi:hypothetical protein
MRRLLFSRNEGSFVLVRKHSISKPEPALLAEDLEDLLAPLAEDKTRVFMNYSSPTLLSTILLETSRWAGVHFIMDPSLERQIQVFSTKSLSVMDAFRVFLASLDSVGLRIVFLSEKIVKVVPKFKPEASGV